MGGILRSGTPYRITVRSAEANARNRQIRFRVARAGGDISALDHTQDRSPAQPARLLALGALLAAALAFIAVLATSIGFQSKSTALLGHPLSARSEAAVQSTPQKLTESPSFTLPFPPNRADRPTRRGEVPSLYDDGLPCSVGCRPQGAEIGWPLAPFHVQHAIRAGLNELRPESLHVGLDIQAWDGAKVYAVQPGVAQVLAPSGPDARVQVGNYIYWHIIPSVTNGELVTPFVTVLGRVIPGYGHMAFSELGASGEYVNPLRRVGSVLKPYVDRAAPVIARPAVSADGQVIVSAYDPQTFVRRTKYFTPVLAPAGLAYRLYDSHGVPVTELEWAFRGTQLLPFAQRSLIFAPGSQAPGYACFASRSVCVPRWTYRVADGLAPPLPTGLTAGRYRLTIYAWDWADNTTALDTTVTMTANGWQPIGRVPAVLSRMPGYAERYLLLPPLPPRSSPPAPREYGRPSYALPPTQAPVAPPATSGEGPSGTPSRGSSGSQSPSDTHSQSSSGAPTQTPSEAPSATPSGGASATR
jgi:hypothetical protein